tara:strand:+ start:280 stop:525 length:246 start_codon:yes stop_codon:yes gene_type:complete
MTSKKATAQDVANDLAKHEIQCTERWKTAFNRFDTIDNNILNVTLNLEQQAKETKNLLIGTLAFLATSFVSIAITLMSVWT